MSSYRGVVRGIQKNLQNPGSRGLAVLATG